MSDLMSANINDRVRVRLTVYGMKLLLDERDTVAGVGQVLASGGVWETPLWELMRVLGPCMHMGMGEMPIEGNRLEFVDVPQPGTLETP